MCRDSTGACDVAEACSATSAACPVDAFLAAGSDCGSNVDSDCDRADACDGAGQCSDDLEPNGSECSATSICGAGECADGTCEAPNGPDCRIEPASSSEGAQFGAALALDTPYLVVGAPGSDPSGRVHVFALGETGFIEHEQASPVAVPFVDPDASDDAIRFGSAVAVDGDTIAVGAPLDAVPAGEGTSHGSVSVFVRGGSSWQLEAKLLDSGGQCTEFGAAVAIHGDRLAAGAPGGGCVLVFERVGGVWSPSGELHGGEVGGRFGASVALSGPRLLVGEPGAKAGPSCSGPGQVVAFERDGTSWAPRGAVIEPETTDGATCFGEALAIDGETAVAGAPADDAAAEDAGAAYVLELAGSAWTLGDRLLAEPAGGSGDRFGTAVAVEGAFVLIGAPGAGAWLFETPTAPLPRAHRSWEPTRNYEPPPQAPAATSEFGAAVALGAGSVAVGAPKEDAGEVTDAGAAYLGAGAGPPGAVCGDSVVSGDEECDDGNTSWSPGEACNGSCLAVACGDPNDSGTLTASDAQFALRAAVNAATCHPEVCDASGNGVVTASDALLILRKAVNEDVALQCP